MLNGKISGLTSGVIEIQKRRIKIVNKSKLVSETIDKLVWTAVFGSDKDKKFSRWLIWEIAQELGIKPSSIHNLYMARGREEVPLNFTVPAMNLRGMVYDMSRAVFKTAKKLDTGAFIVEIARSESGYTDQPPEEFATVVLAGAIKEGWKGPVFIQGDHDQAKAISPGIPKEGDIGEIEKLIRASIKAGFYNIDVDISTLVDLNEYSIQDQQEANIKYSAQLIKLIRSLEPKDYPISIGGEIGHIGDENSSVSDFVIFIDGLKDILGPNVNTISKVSVQTGTTHGGKVLPDGSLAKVDVDFSVLSEISKVARKEYQIGGAVQHGASTLPEDLFSNFPKSQTLEIHLATGFQNIMMDHPKFPRELLKEMYDWLDKEKSDEKKKEWNAEQFHYKLRKKAWGQFKKECWGIERSAREEIRSSLEKKFEFLFKALNVSKTRSLVNKYIKPKNIHKKPSDFGIKSITSAGTGNLDD